MKLAALRRSERELRALFAAAPGRAAESTHAEQEWQIARRAVPRWALAGAFAGAAVAAVAFAPAAWLATAIAGASDERLLLADPRGTVWNGSAAIVLTGGADSRDAAALPGRLHWSVRPGASGLEVRLELACCLTRPVALTLKPGIGRFAAVLQPPGAQAHWPAAWLAGLGTPWNTLRPSGEIRLQTKAFSVEWAQGRWIAAGNADLELAGVGSRLSTIDPLGSYKLTLKGDAAVPGASALTLTTLEGPLRLSGSGVWNATGVRFAGEASAEPGSEAGLNNLLNIIGRRSGARSIISLG